MMSQDRAEALAADALAWLAGDEDLLTGFLGTTGAGIEDLRARAGEPEFLGFVLDFLLSDEGALLAYCAARRLPPETPAHARAILPGGAVPNWT